jgi:hypothetical protein
MIAGGGVGVVLMFAQRFFKSKPAIASAFEAALLA